MCSCRAGLHQWTKSLEGRTSLGLCVLKGERRHLERLLGEPSCCQSRQWLTRCSASIPPGIPQGGCDDSSPPPPASPTLAAEQPLGRDSWLIAAAAILKRGGSFQKWSHAGVGPGSLAGQAPGHLHGHTGSSAVWWWSSGRAVAFCGRSLWLLALWGGGRERIP